VPFSRCVRVEKPHGYAPFLGKVPAIYIKAGASSGTGTACTVTCVRACVSVCVTQERRARVERVSKCQSITLVTSHPAMATGPVLSKLHALSSLSLAL
jgi:hypothetical protein